MSLFYCVNGIEHIRFQICLIPFFIDQKDKVQLPPVYEESKQFFHFDYRSELQSKIDALPQEQRERSISYLWVERLKKPAVLFYNDSGNSPLQKVLHNALSVANMKGTTIALPLFRNNFGRYYTAEDVITEITIEECKQFSFGRKDIDMHIILSTLDTKPYAAMKQCSYMVEECTPNFVPVEEEKS